jgi:hypothetical protein
VRRGFWRLSAQAGRGSATSARPTAGVVVGNSSGALGRPMKPFSRLMKSFSAADEGGEKQGPFAPARRAQAYEGRIRKSSSSLPDLSSAVSQRGCFPRPAQVSPGCAGFLYFGATCG